MQTTASTPRFLGLAGIILLAISAGIIVAGIALPNRPQTSSPASSVNAPSGVDRDGEGVPLDALQPPDPGSLSECTVTLKNWESYATNAAQAEIKAYGVEIAKATPDAIISSLQSLPQLQLHIRFLVLYSPSHPWSRSFQDVAALQTSLLDAAFSGMKLGFQLEGVVGISTTDEQVQNCGNPESQSDPHSSSQDGGGDDNEEGRIKSGSFISQVLQSVETSSLINVIVCDPVGVNGATNVLGDKIDTTNDESSTEHDDGHSKDHFSIVHSQNVLDRSIVLRRGALWQSRTSLVHQLGHYLGLPHPFPNTKTCKYDADTIVDTPQQYQSSTSCDAGQPVPLCDENYKLSLEVERYPMYGFMETSTGIVNSNIDSYSGGAEISDTLNGDCRKHFSPGQVLRARAMLRMLRPELHKTAPAASKSEGEQVMKRLPWSRYDESNSKGVTAFQSGLPSAAVVARQLALWNVSATAAAALTASALALNTPPQQQQTINTLFPNSKKAMTRITSALDQALQAAGESRGSTSLEECTCLGPDEAGNVFWTGKLDAVYSVDAVRIVQPWESVVNTTFLATILRSRKDSSPLSSSAAAVHDQQVSPSLPSPSPQPEVLPVSQSVLPSAAPGPANQILSVAVPIVEIRVGDSPNFSKNNICKTVELPGDDFIQHIACRSRGSLRGQFITVRWTNAQKVRPLTASTLVGILSMPVGAAAAAAAAAEAAAAVPPSCLCDVAALSYSSLPIRTAVAATGQVPGALLNITSFSTAGEGKQPRSSSLTSCSTMTSSAAGKEASWSMPLVDNPSSTTDPILINGVRFSTPNRCSGLSTSKSKPPAAPSSSSSSSQDIVPLLWEPLEWNTTSLKCGDTSAAVSGSGLSNNKNVTLDIYVFPYIRGKDGEKRINGRKEEYLCAGRVEVPPGQLVDIECDRTVEGHVITFFLSSSSSMSMSSPLAENSKNRPTAAAAGGGGGGAGDGIDSVELLELCGVQPIGGIPLINSDIIAAEQQTTIPESLMPLFSLAVDGDIKTCLLVEETTSLTRPTFGAESAGSVGVSESSGGNSSAAAAADFRSIPADEEFVVDSALESSTPASLWKTGLNGDYLIVDVKLTTKTRGISPGNSNGNEDDDARGAIKVPGMQLTLFDAAGKEVAVKNFLSSSQPAGFTSTSEQGDITTQVISVAIIPPVYAKTVQITGFTSLCEVTFIAASRTPRR